MVFSRMIDKIPFLYADSAKHTDDTVSAVNRRKLRSVRPIRLRSVRVQKTVNWVLEKAMNNLKVGLARLV